MPGTAPYCLMKATMGFIGSMKRSSHRPRSAGVVHPRGSTFVDSMKTSPQPPAAYLPKCMKCHSFTFPSTAEYVSIGDSTILFFRRTVLRVIGEKSIVSMAFPICCFLQLTRFRSGFQYLNELFAMRETGNAPTECHGATRPTQGET